MKLTEEVPQPATIIKKQIGTQCDICHQDFLHARAHYPGTDWASRRGYDLNVITIQHREGEHYPESDFEGKQLDVDCCPECWTTKVLPTLRAYGLKRDYVCKS